MIKIHYAVPGMNVTTCSSCEGGLFVSLTLDEYAELRHIGELKRKGVCKGKCGRRAMVSLRYPVPKTDKRAARYLAMKLKKRWNDV